MSRCNICDYSQSADSLYNSGIALSNNSPSNRVVFSPALEKDICLHCLEEYHQQQTFWQSIDGDEEDVFEAEADTEGSTYPGCTDIPAD